MTFRSPQSQALVVPSLRSGYYSSAFAWASKCHRHLLNSTCLTIIKDYKYVHLYMHLYMHAYVGVRHNCFRVGYNYLIVIVQWKCIKWHNARPLQ